MADELRIDDRLSIPLAEIELRTSRSSGPGGQHANVTASRVEAVFDIAASLEDAWARREEALFERLTVSWVISDLPLDEQKMLIGRYRMATPEE
ncbi:MAG TPA: hypothetical protein VFR04_05475, partial [Solirubrobacterales bacterium]|nr:hypothetical protein [Solirubrobacterales bacterium]